MGVCRDRESELENGRHTRSGADGEVLGKSRRTQSVTEAEGPGMDLRSRSEDGAEGPYKGRMKKEADIPALVLRVLDSQQIEYF